jgi:hypothetical protein
MNKLENLLVLAILCHLNDKIGSYTALEYLQRTTTVAAIVELSHGHFFDLVKI